MVWWQIIIVVLGAIFLLDLLRVIIGMFKGGASDLTYYIFRPLFIPMKMFYAEGETLEKVIWLNGKPKNLRCDNGPEFIAKEFQEWCKGNDTRL